MTRLTAALLLVCLGWGLAVPIAVRADANAAHRVAAQKHNRKRSRKDVRQMKKELKKSRKARR